MRRKRILDWRRLKFLALVTRLRLLLERVEVPVSFHRNWNNSRRQQRVLFAKGYRSSKLKRAFVDRQVVHRRGVRQVGHVERASF